MQSLSNLSKTMDTSHEFWLSLANEWRRSKSIDLPLYWKKTNSGYMNYTLAGWKAVDPNASVTHLSYFEADAFACWKGLGYLLNLNGKLTLKPKILRVVDF